jgi:hypothetical protein
VLPEVLHEFVLLLERLQSLPLGLHCEQLLLALRQAMVLLGKLFGNRHAVGILLLQPLLELFERLGCGVHIPFGCGKKLALLMQVLFQCRQLLVQLCTAVVQLLQLGLQPFALDAELIVALLPPAELLAQGFMLLLPALALLAQGLRSALDIGGALLELLQCGFVLLKAPEQQCMLLFELLALALNLPALLVKPLVGLPGELYPLLERYQALPQLLDALLVLLCALVEGVHLLAELRILHLLLRDALA